MSGVFSSLPPDVNTLVSQEDLDAVRSQIESAGSWITSAEIARRLEWPKQRTAERVRRAVKELQLTGCRIVESNAGFSMAHYRSMVERAIEKTDLRMQGLSRTRAAYVRMLEGFE